MEKTRSQTRQRRAQAPAGRFQVPPEETVPELGFNDNLTALPKDEVSPEAAAANADLASDALDYGEMSLEDARASGYTDEEGKAIDPARQEPVGRPTGAYTDVGAGRSSAVTPKNPERR